MTIKRDLYPLIFDIHGVLLGRREPVGHRTSGDVIRALRKMGYPLRFLTNSSSISHRALVEQLATAGVQAEIDEIYTAAVVVAHYLRTSKTPIKLYVIGSANLRTEIVESCRDNVVCVSPENADTIVISRDPSLNDEVLERLMHASNPRLIATCRDLQFPDGTTMNAGPGPTVKRVETALGREAWVIGKPNTYVLTHVMGLAPEALAGTIVVGDSIEQDVALCKSAGSRSVLVLNEFAAINVENTGNASCRPDHTIEAIDQLFSLLQVAA